MHVVKLLKQSGADSSLKNHDGDTAADVAGGENSMVPDGLDLKNHFFENMDEKVADDEDDDRASGRRRGRGGTRRKNREKSGSDDDSYDSGIEDDE